MARPGKNKGQWSTADLTIELGAHTIPMRFRFDVPLDMDRVNELSDALDEVRDAGFTREEENELVYEITRDYEPEILAGSYLVGCQSRGEPVHLERKTVGTIEVFLDGANVCWRQVKTADFGVRDQKSNVEHAVEFSDPPYTLSGAEAELWERDPHEAIRAGIARGDQRWIKFARRLRDDADEQKDQEDQTLEHFFEIQNTLLKASKGPDEPATMIARLAWSFLRQARVFHIDAVIFQEIVMACDRQCTEGIAGLPYEAPTGLPPTYVHVQQPPQSQEHIDAVTRAAPASEMPENFPFEVMYLGFGPGIQLRQYQMEAKLRASLSRTQLVSVGGDGDDWSEIEPQILAAQIIGHIVTSTGHVIECVKIETNDGEEGIITEHLRNPDEGFRATFDLAPWYVPKLIEFIVSHKTFVLEQDLSPEQRKTAKQLRKGGGRRGSPAVLWIPPPYYRMRMQTKVVRDRTKRMMPTMPGRPRTYRTDVVGHSRHYVRRGPLPLTPEQRAVLTKRQYTIYENTQPPAELVSDLTRKGHDRKDPGEWMAVREIWIDEHMNVDNPDLPYVPGLRTTGSRS